MMGRRADASPPNGRMRKDAADGIMRIDAPAMWSVLSRPRRDGRDMGGMHRIARPRTEGC